MKRMRSIGQHCLRDQRRGQTLLEFLIVLPLILVFIKITLKVNAASQISINNQKALHSKILDLASNSPFFPRIANHEVSFVKKNRNFMTIGMVAGPFDDANPATQIAPIHEISRDPATQAIKGPPGQEARSTTGVRVRTSAGMCPQVIAINVNGRWDHYSHLTVSDKTQPFPFCEGVEL